MPSFKSKLITAVFRIINLKKRLMKAAENPPRSKKGFVPKKTSKLFNVKVREVNSKTIATLESKTKVTNTHIVFLHGGAYFFEATALHWNFAKDLIDKTTCRMTMVDYPLSPEHDYRETFAMLDNSYKQLIEAYPNDQFILMGDSAGGGLAFAFSQKLINDNSSSLPIKNVLLSPWLDLTMSNPDIKEVEPLDKILSVKVLNFCANKYANGEDQNHYLLSPINGNLENLADTIIFYGTHEIFIADCQKLKENAKNSNSRITFKEYEGMQHDWLLFPIPERKELITEICNFIKQ